VRARDRACVVVPMDGFHQPRAVRYRQGRESPDGYYEDAYDFAALRDALLGPLGPTGNGRYRTSVLDLRSDQRVAAEPGFAPAGLVVIVDGSFLQRPELDGSWDAVVFLRVSFDAARARGAARDSSLLGSTEDALRL
jgi:uridine kinase